MTPDSPEVIPMIKNMGKGGNHTNVVNGITPGRRWGIEIPDFPMSVLAPVKLSLSLHQNASSEWWSEYCWWKNSCTDLGCKEPVNNGINYQPQLVCRLSEPSTVWGVSVTSQNTSCFSYHSPGFFWFDPGVWWLKGFRKCTNMLGLRRLDPTPVSWDGWKVFTISIIAEFCWSTVFVFVTVGVFFVWHVFG